MHPMPSSPCTRGEGSSPASLTLGALTRAGWDNYPCVNQSSPCRISNRCSINEYLELGERVELLNSRFTVLQVSQTHSRERVGNEGLGCRSQVSQCCRSVRPREGWEWGSGVQESGFTVLQVGAVSSACLI